MSQYTGCLAEAMATARTANTVREPSSTLYGVQRVVITDGQGNERPIETPPGSSPDAPLWVGSATGETNRVRLEGGPVSSIEAPVRIAGPITVTLTDAQLAALLPQRLVLDAAGRLAVQPPPADPAPGSAPDFPLWVGSVDGGQNRATLDGGALDAIRQPVVLGGATRPIPVALTDAQARALASIPMPQDYAGRVLVALPAPDPVIAPELSLVTVDGTITQRPETSSANAQYAVLVSTTAVRLAPSNAARKCLVITNSGSGTLYLGNTSAVAASGAGLGLAVPANQCYADSGDGLSTGEVWGIYSASASTQNVAVSDRS